jgi:hypothetical protein
VDTTLPSGNWAQAATRPKFRAKTAARDARLSNRGSRAKLPDVLTCDVPPTQNPLSRQTGALPTEKRPAKFIRNISDR